MDEIVILIIVLIVWLTVICIFCSKWSSELIRNWNGPPLKVKNRN